MVNQISQLSEQDQQLIVDYLLGELDEIQTTAFEARLKSDTDFAQQVSAQSQLEGIMARGSQPVIDKKRQEGVHWALNKSLRKQAGDSQSFWSALKNLVNFQVTFKAQFASMLATFALGFMVANSYQAGNEPKVAETSEEMRRAGYELQPVKLIQPGDYEITDLTVDSIDPSSGAVQVTYSLASQTVVNGKLNSPEIQSLLASTMKNEVSDATRLDLVEILKEHSETALVRETLSHSLLNDPNPGVRMAAAESLALLSHDKKIRDILRLALTNDVNPGIRIEAFQALIQHLDDKETIEAFKDFSVNDSNPFIREQARKIVSPPSRENI
ncbi:MAG: HEAT repeat domain-containing protein [Kangiellaceae bacterium]|nr:HEAT repeat domain-containing protein [Kangiellaceae bacterium]MCW8997441.1 HEAT repeat domain-containing protein [Kangiellaceae bacterium]